MMQCALTGGIGSGKSVVCKIFSLLGAEIFHADDVAKSLYLRPEIISLIRAAFGPACIKEGRVDFKSLAAIVFNHPGELKKLDLIIHPLVMDEYEHWLDTQPSGKICIMESAIIFESELENNFDQIICVYAPEQVCLRRVMERDGVTEDQARARMNSQMDPVYKVKKSGFVIINDDEHMLIPQVLKVYEQLKQTVQ